MTKTTLNERLQLALRLCYIHGVLSDKEFETAKKRLAKGFYVGAIKEPV